MDFKSCVIVLTVFCALCVCVKEVVSLHDNLKEPVLPQVTICCNGSQDCSNEHNITVESLDEAKNLPVNFSVSRGEPVCESGGFLSKHSESWNFHKDGSVEIIFGPDAHEIYTHEKYCLFRDKTDDEIYIKTCQYPYEDTLVEKIKELYPYLMLFSIPFLVVTLLVYASLKELHGNLHGKCLMGYLIGLIGFYVCFCLIQLSDETFIENEKLCESIGLFTYFCVLVCFFWLNILCFDIYSTFRRVVRKNSNRRKFLIYCLYALGVPLLIIGMVAIAEYLLVFPNHSMNIAGNGCFIETQNKLFYVYVPMSCTIGFNMLFYAITAYKIFQVQKETSITRKGDSSTHSRVNQEKSRFFLYLRLFVVMGVLWIIEILSYFAGDSAVLHIADTVNCFQGIFIFVLFVCKASVKKLIIKKFKSQSSSHNHQTYVSTFTTQTSSTSTYRQRQHLEMEEPKDNPTPI